MPATMTKERFLSNKRNKQRLIAMLIEGLLSQNSEVMQAVKDADSTIISNALQLRQQSRTAVIFDREEFERSSISNQLFIRKRLLLMKYNEADYMTVYLLNFEKTSKQLKEPGGKMEVLDCVLLLSLPKSYQALVGALETLDQQKLTLDSLKSRLMDEYNKRKKPKLCNKFPRRFKTSSKKSQVVNNEERDAITWILDSGASEHMITTLEYFYKLEDLEIPVQITIAKDGRRIKEDNKRSSRLRKPVIWQKDYQIYTDHDMNEMGSLCVAFTLNVESYVEPNIPDSVEEFSKKEKIDALYKNKTWDLEDLPADRKAINCKWVFSVKRNEKGEIERYKARLVAKVVKLTTLRCLLAIANEKEYLLHHMDFKTAFLNGYIKETIYLTQPSEYETGTGEKVCKLNKPLYGLKQSSRECSRKQNCVALSSTEAEYIALSITVSECLWLLKLLQDLNMKTTDFIPTMIYEDNQGCLYILQHGKDVNRLEHINVRYNFVCDIVKKRLVNLAYDSKVFLIFDEQDDRTTLDSDSDMEALDTLA
ncbi:hypothetical protein ILUMI_21629 [Ignelater luminosus]|uniref:Reverse transcriptase Ty1/copia-type domain-containing protein n=1 Tax=Ignelater luminosus TaxID=2038154 RepID=A0A8K0G3D4_IGNLU|nr:hypothetical protein ILUMI_21629 [Ignelater luminosus]